MTMLVPLFGFLISLAVALLLGGAAVRLDPRLRPITGATFAFVASAFAGAILYAVFYTRLFADQSHHLSTGVAVLGFLAGLVVAAAFVGWLGARWFAVVWSKYRVHH
jgi:hypothetical protein